MDWIERLPRWARWILFAPAAVVAMSLAHFVVSIAFYGNGDRASVLGFDVEGSGARWINVVMKEGLTRFVELLAFVAVGGMMAPKRRAVGLVLCGIAITMALLPMFIHMYFLHPQSKIGLALLRAIPGILGGVAGFIAVRNAEISEASPAVEPGGRG